MNDIIGKKFNKLTALKMLGKGYYLFKCDCGTIKKIKRYNVISGQTKSCGCYHKETVGSYNKRHGLSKHPLYKTWHNMRSRCKNPNATKYYIYGGKGIKVCSEWDNNFKSFYDWSIRSGYKKGLSIDRINSNGDYEPNNCRWTTITKQNNNTSQNHLITYYGKTMTIAQWARYKGLSQKILSERIRRNWSIKRALSTPKVDIKNFGEFIKNYKGGD